MLKGPMPMGTKRWEGPGPNLQNIPKRTLDSMKIVGSFHHKDFAPITIDGIRILNNVSLLIKRTELLEDFLSKNGITVPFLQNVKKAHGCEDMKDYVTWLHHTKFNFANAFYLAFYWHPKDPIPWKEHAQNWKAFLKGGSPYGPA